MLLFIINTKLVWIVSATFSRLWMTTAMPSSPWKLEACDHLVYCNESVVPCSLVLVYLWVAMRSCPAFAQVRYVTRGGRVHTLKPVRLQYVNVT